MKTKIKYSEKEKFTQKLLIKNIKIFVMINKGKFSDTEKKFFHSVIKKLKKANLTHEKKCIKLNELFKLVIEIFSEKK